MFIDKLFGMFSKDMAIDLGTANTLVYVKGEGVVGEQPILNPGEKFEYTSGTPLSTPSGFMEGHYERETKKGYKFDADIPQFSLDSPFTSDKLN